MSQAFGLTATSSELPADKAKLAAQELDSDLTRATLEGEEDGR
jgi:hypothetical protein